MADDTAATGSGITLTALYKEQVVISAQLTVITDRLGAIPDHEARLRGLESITDRLSQLTDHEARLRNLERWRYALPASAITAAGSWCLSVVALVHR
jgi:hypothetical protein